MRSGLSLFSLAMFASSAAFADDRGFGTHGGYDVAGSANYSAEDGWSDGGCVMTTEFNGPGDTKLALSRFDAHPNIVFVSVENLNWSTVKGQDYEVKYVIKNATYERSASGTDDGAYHGLFTGFPFTQFMTYFSKSPFLHIYRGTQTVDNLDTSGAAAAKVAFDQCWAWVLAKKASANREHARYADIPKDPFAPGPAGASEGVEALTDSRALFSADDYPADAQKANEQGTARFQLDVAADGSVTACRITQSTGSVSLDAKTCAVATDRMKFKATGKSGHYDSKPITWSLNG